MMKIQSNRKKQIQIISAISISVIILLVVIYHILVSSKLKLKNLGIANNFNCRKRSAAKSTREFSVVKILSDPKSEAFYGEKLVHLDLKGAPPSISYLRDFFPYIKRLGATGVLIEYEDTFYYKEDLEDMRAVNAYQPSEIKTILELAEENNLTVIPLVQTFGHVEFVLKLEKFKDLREIKQYPQAFCPSHERVLPVIQKMIDQILEAHPKAKYIHIGCDEVFYLGQCDKCKSLMQNNSWQSPDLFLNHVKNIASYINKTHGGVRPIIWDDVIRTYDEKLLNESKISSFVDLMLWKYVPYVMDCTTNDLLTVYARVFKNIWIASAFKGTTGVNQIITDVKYHLANHIVWMKTVSNWKDRINFKGIAITGWQRYDHFAELCELLPVAIPSLAINLHYLKVAEKGITEDDLLEILQCYPLFPLFSIGFDFSTVFEKCDFPGYFVYKLVHKFNTLSSEIKQHFSIVYEGWFSVHSIVNKFSNPTHVKNIFIKWRVEKILKELTELEEGIKNALLNVYDEYTTEEWIMNYITPIRLKLEAFYIVKRAMLERDVWPRRPLLNNTNDLERIAKEICNSESSVGCALILM